MAVIPKDQFDKIASEHLKNDEGFQAAIKYFKGEEWKNNTDILLNHPHWISLKNLLEDAGIDLDNYIDNLVSFIVNVKTPDYVPSDAKKDLKPFIEDLRKAMPTTEIFDKLESTIMITPEYEKMFEKLSSPESRKALETSYKVPEFKKIVQSLIEMGIQVNEIINAIYVFLGWH